MRGLKRALAPGKSNKSGERPSVFAALATALGGSAGTGNIAGVAGALAISGLGAIFWMWISGVLGMATKYAEVLVAMKFRERMPDGRYRGGTMGGTFNSLMAMPNIIMLVTLAPIIKRATKDYLW